MAFTDLTDKAVKRILARYDVGELQGVKIAGNGIENSNYFVTTATDGHQRELVLTVLEQPSNARDQLVRLLDHCAAAGLPVADVLRNRNGDAFDSIADKPVMLCNRLSGQHVFNPTRVQCAAVGRVLARLHLAGVELSADLPPYPRDAAWLKQTEAGVRAHLSFSDRRLLADSVARLDKLLNRDDVKLLPTGLIHGDLFRDNVLFTGQGLSGLLDFHHASRGIALFDIAVAANDWCTDSSGVLDVERSLALLKAYHTVRPLRAQEIWLFPTFLLYAATAFWLSRLEVIVAAANRKVRSKNPDEFRDIVQQHTAHSLYVDPRMLEAS